MAGRGLTLATEGRTDLVVLERLAVIAGWCVTGRHGGRGKQHLLKRLPAYNEASVHAP